MADEITEKVNREWQIYAAACFGTRRIGTVQYRETRQAFLSGMFTAIVLIADLANGVDVNTGAQRLEQFNQEVQAQILSGMISEAGVKIQ
jgi:hypothetical protein